MYTWIKNLALYYIFLTAILNFLPDSRYTKYIRYFMGMLLILMAASPILQLLSLENPIKGSFDKYALEEEFEKSRWGNLYADDTQEEYLAGAYQTQIEQDIRKLLEEEGEAVAETEAAISVGREIEVTGIAVRLEETYSEDKEAKIRQELGEIYQISGEQIQVLFQENREN